MTVFESPLAFTGVRYTYGFGFLVTILLVQVASNCLNVKFIGIYSKISVATLTFFMLIFPFIYASMLQHQEASFERQSLILTDDIKGYVSSKRKTVYINYLFNNSKVVESGAVTYPILNNLVLSNSMIYWPNTMLFNTYSGLDVDIQALDLTNFSIDGTSVKGVVSNYYYDIYVNDVEIFVVRK